LLPLDQRGDLFAWSSLRDVRTICGSGFPDRSSATIFPIHN